MTAQREQARPAQGVPCSIEIDDVHKAFGRQKVLDGLTVNFPEGAVTAIVGPSGTGKSVLIKHIVRLMKPDRGDVRIFGESIVAMSDSQLFKLREAFGVLFQDGALFGSMNVYDNVAFPLRRHTRKAEDEIADIVFQRLRDVGLEQAAYKAPSEISGGMRKRAGFARALVLNPKILMFDEPDSGLDPVRTSLLNDLILDTHEQYGGTYMVVTHDLATARRISDHVGLLWQGKLLFWGSIEEALSSDDPFVRQFMSGESAGPLGMD